MTSHPTLEPADGPRVDIVRSRNRRRTVSAYRDGDRTVVQVPAGLSAAEEQRWVADMIGRLDRREARSRKKTGDEGLSVRAASLSARYLEGRARPANVRWVTNQNSRWGSCTPADGTIRLSHRLRGMPAYVVDYVLVHELVHLLVPGHGPDFWRLVEHYPRTERARGFLEGVALTAGLNLDPDVDGGGLEDDSGLEDDAGLDVAHEGPAA